MSRKGLRTFGFHSQDGGNLAAALRPEPDAAARAAGIERLSQIDPETAARQYVENALASSDVPAFTADEVGGLSSEFRTIGTETVPLTGTRTVKFRQHYRRVPVYGSLVTVELDEGNELVSMSSSLAEPHNVDPVAKLPPAEVLEIVRANAGSGPRPLDAVPRLFYYFDDQVARWRLAYVVERVTKYGPGGEDGAAPHVAGIVDFVVDAHTGEIVAQPSRTPSVQPAVDTAVDGLGVSRRFSFSVDPVTFRRQMHDPALNVRTHDFRFNDVELMGASLPGGFVSLPPPPWSPAAVSAHANATEVATFLREVLGRNGVDARGGRLVSSINCTWQRLGSVGQEWRNAAWISTQMVYGQRRVDGSLRSYALALDIVAHEIFHGVIEHTADLQYLGMPGALNESYADIFGIIVSNARQPDIDQWNWVMGEDLDGTGVPIRDLRDPERHGQPAHMRDYRRLPLDDDNGGVHVNSGIHNRAAFLIISAKDDQGRHLFDARSAAAIFYVALTAHLSRQSDFSHARLAAVLAAQTLFRNDPARGAKVNAVKDAYASVGIDGAETLADVDTRRRSPDGDARPLTDGASRGPDWSGEIESALEAIQLLKLLPEDERTGHYDDVVAPLIRRAAAALRPQEPASVAQWLQIQSSTLNWAVEGISEVTYELSRNQPEALEQALSMLPPEQRIRVRQLLKELSGQESLPPASAARHAGAAADFLKLATALTAAPPSETRIFAEFVGGGTFQSSRGFPVYRGTLSLLTPEGHAAATFSCNNGGGAPNFRMRNGPLPPGVYRVSNHRPNRTTRGMVHQSVGYSFDLDPTDGTQVFGRSLFRIHPDGNPLGTNGCIGVREDAAALRDCEARIAALLRDDGPFKILIRY